MVGKQRAFFLAVVLLPVFLFFGLVFLSPGASARLGLVKTETRIEIDGVSYGVINDVNKLSDLTLDQQKDDTFTRVSLRRDFVTEPSIYQWAFNNTQSRKLAHISITTQTLDGVKIARYELNDCKPLDFNFGTVDPLQGGFSENVVLAVQEINVH